MVEKPFNHIEYMAPQCPPYDRSEGKEIECLRKSFMYYEWLKNSMRNISSSNYSFNAFITALIDTYLWLMATATLIKIVAIETLFQQYGYNPLHVINHRLVLSIPKDIAKETFSSSFEENRRRALCQRCKTQ